MPEGLDSVKGFGDGKKKLWSDYYLITIGK